MEIEKHTLERVYLPTETLGSWYDAKGKLICKTMELPWLGNRRDDPKTKVNEASCIPEDTYLVMKQAPSFGRDYGYFRFKDVKGRGFNQAAGGSTILVHRITYVKDLLGCIGVGGKFQDINGDGVPDMIESGKTLEWMYKTLPDLFLLTIKKK
jgi:hypothetical protein